MKLSALLGKVEKTQIKIAGEDGAPDEFVEVHYRPGALTLQITDKLKDAQESGWDVDVVPALLEPLLVYWDLEEDVVDADGNPTGETQPLACNAEGIRKVPLSFLGLILDQVNREARPDPTQDETSDGTSPLAAESDVSQSGTTSSGSPDTLVSLPGSSSTDQ